MNRAFAGLLMIWTGAGLTPLFPSPTYWIPPLLPLTQKFNPASVVAERAFPPLNALSNVVVSTVAAESILATTRFTAAVVLAATLAVPVTVAYPARVTYFLFTERESAPSDAALPARVNGLFEPVTAVGSETVRTGVVGDPPT